MHDLRAGADLSALLNIDQKMYTELLESACRPASDVVEMETLMSVEHIYEPPDSDHVQDMLS